MQSASSCTQLGSPSDGVPQALAGSGTAGINSTIERSTSVHSHQDLQPSDWHSSSFKKTTPEKPGMLGDSPYQHQSQEREPRSGTSALHKPSPGDFPFSYIPAAYPQSRAANLPVAAPCAPYQAIHPFSFPPPSTSCPDARASSYPEAADFPSLPSQSAHLEQFWKDTLSGANRSACHSMAPAKTNLGGLGFPVDLPATPFHSMPMLRAASDAQLYTHSLGLPLQSPHLPLKTDSGSALVLKEKQNAMDVPSLGALSSLGLTEFEDYVMGEEPGEALSSATAAPLSAVVLPEQPLGARSGNSPPTAQSAPLHAAIRSFSLSPAGSAHTLPRAAARRLRSNQAPAPHQVTRPSAGEGPAILSAAQNMPTIPPAQAFPVWDLCKAGSHGHSAQRSMHKAPLAGSSSSMVAVQKRVIQKIYLQRKKSKQEELVARIAELEAECVQLRAMVVMLWERHISLTRALPPDLLRDDLRFLASMGPVQRKLYDSGVKQRLLQDYIQGGVALYEALLSPPLTLHQLHIVKDMAKPSQKDLKRAEPPELECEGTCSLLPDILAELQVKDTQIERLGSEGRDIVAWLDPMLRKCRGHVQRLLAMIMKPEVTLYHCQSSSAVVLELCAELEHLAHSCRNMEGRASLACAEVLTTRQSAKLRRIAKGPCGVHGALCAQAYYAQLEVRMDSMEVEGFSLRIGREQRAAGGPQQPSAQVAMSSESSGDHSMPGSLSDDISNMVTGHPMSSGHSAGVPAQATRVTLPPNTPTSRAFARALSAPDLAGSRLGGVLKTAQGSTSDWGTATLHTPAASSSSAAALNSMLEHAAEQSPPPVQLQSPRTLQARPKWPAQTRPHKFASLKILSQQ